MSPSLTNDLLCGDFDELIEALKKAEKGHMIGTTDMCGIHTAALIRTTQTQKKILDHLERDSEERKQRCKEADAKRVAELKQQIADMNISAENARRERRETLQWAVGTTITLSVVLVPILFYVAKHVF